MLLGIHWGLPNHESWNGDDLSPSKPLRVVHDWLRGNHKYPYLQWWLNLALYAPWLLGVAAAGELDLGCFPRLRAECFADPLRDMTVFMAISRLLSVAMGLGIVLGTRRLALALHGDRAAALFAALICAASPTLVFFCHTGNVDAPHVFWFSASLVAAVSVWRRGTPLDHAAFGLLAGCALATKDTVIGAYVLPGLALLGVHGLRVSRERGAARRAAAPGGAARPPPRGARRERGGGLRAGAERALQSFRARRALPDLDGGRSGPQLLPGPPGRAAPLPPAPAAQPRGACSARRCWRCARRAPP